MIPPVDPIPNGRGSKNGGYWSTNVMGARAEASFLGQFPELGFAEQRDAVAPLAQALDLHELQSAFLSGGLQRIRPAAHHDRGARGWSAMNDCPRPPRRAGGHLSRLPQDSGE